jgi:molybdate transport system permease protein
MGGLGLSYAVLIVAMLVGDLAFLVWSDLVAAWGSRELRFAFGLSVLTCTVAAGLALLVAVPAGYVMARWQPAGSGRMVRQGLEVVFDVPIVLPPLVVGLSLLILFQAWPLREAGVTYEVPAVVLAQFTVAAAFAVRAMRATFEQLDPRTEQVALTLGCSRWQAFRRVALPEARGGVVGAFTLAWARSLGEFGPVLVFAGATRMKTEVLATSVFLELNVGNLGGAVAVSLVMVGLATVVLIGTRLLGARVGGAA